MVMVIYSALVRSHQSTSADSFGLVRPAWIEYTRSAVPQNVEGLTRPPRTTPNYGLPTVYGLIMGINARPTPVPDLAALPQYFVTSHISY